MEKDLAVAGRGGAGIREVPSGLGCHRQVHGGAGNRWAERHRAQHLLPRAKPVPGASGTLAAGIPGCQLKASAQLVDAIQRDCRALRAEGACQAPRPGPEGDQAARAGAQAWGYPDSVVSDQDLTVVSIRAVTH
jgi:hypothetical protein